MALHPPAKCSNCGLVFHATAIAVSDSINVMITGSRQSCPQCGHMASIGDGVYDFIGDKVTLTSGPESTADMLRALAQTVRDSIAAGESPEKTVERAAEFLPWLSGWKGRLAATAFNILVGWAGGKMLDKAFDSPPPEPPAITLQELKDAFREELEKAKQDGLLTQPPTPNPASRPSPGAQRHPMLVKFPITAQKLADYEKESGKVNQFPRGLA